MDIDTLKQFFDSNKITEADFCLLVTQKINNMFGTNDKKIIKKIMDVRVQDTFDNLGNNPYEQYYNILTTYDLIDKRKYNIVDLYKDTYKQFYNGKKSQKYDFSIYIFNAKYELTKKKFVNKVKKQVTHLMGETKLKALSRKDASHLKEMADENRLTTSDFKAILKYKLEELLGKDANKNYNKYKDKYKFIDALKTFYDNPSNNREPDRESAIKKTFDDYDTIEKCIETSTARQIATKYNKKNISNVTDSKLITFTNYVDFCKIYAPKIKKILEIANEYDKNKDIPRKWVDDQIKQHKLPPEEEYRKELQRILNEDLLKSTTMANQISYMNDNYSSLKTPQMKHLFNFFKLIDDSQNAGTWSKEQFDHFSSIFEIVLDSIQCDAIAKYANKESSYMMPNTKTKIQEKIEELKKKAQIPPPPAYKPKPPPSKNNNRPPKPNFNPPTPSIEELLKQMPNPPKSN